MSWSRRYEDHTSSDLGVKPGGAGPGPGSVPGSAKPPPSVGGSVAAGRRMRAPSQITEIEEEMKLLRWHKMANESALKAAIIRTKKMKQRNKDEVARERNREKALWMQQVVEEENAKTLEVTDEFIRHFEEEERREEERLEREVECHIRCLQRLQRELVAREELRKRNTIYRQRHRAWQAKYEGRKPRPEAPTASAPDVRAKQASNVTRGASEAVTHTLSQLMNLERRITDLEVAGAARSVDFSARQQPARGAKPSATVFAVAARRPAPGSRTAPAARARGRRSDATVNRWLRQRQQQAQQRRAHLRARSERQQAAGMQRSGGAPRRRNPQQWHEVRRQLDRERRDVIADARRTAAGAGSSAPRRRAGPSSGPARRGGERGGRGRAPPRRAWGADVGSARRGAPRRGGSRPTPSPMRGRSRASM